MTRTSSIGQLGPALVVLALVAALTVVGTRAVNAAPDADPDPGVGSQGHRAQFVVECRWSHRANDDPIVLPGDPGASHLHEFFGATSTDASSTAQDLLGGDTTCQRKADTAAYWVPALYDHGDVVTPRGIVAYYRPGLGVDPATVQPYPTGLKMIAGDALAHEPQPVGVAAWHCGSGPALSATPPDCPEHARLAMRLVFPDCWDGSSLDSVDHRAHVARSVRGLCPLSHPVAIPQLTVDVQYPLWGEGHQFQLASGEPITAHGDFLNSWDPDKLRTDVELCLNTGNICGVHSIRATG